MKIILLRIFPPHLNQISSKVVLPTQMEHPRKVINLLVRSHPR